MPELPDITVYVECLERLVVGDTLHEMKLRSPFLLRTALPPWREAQGRRVVGVERLAKRIVIALEGELFMVFHLMRLGRFQWLPAEPAAAAKAGAKVPAGKALLARFRFDRGTLVMTEQGKILRTPANEIRTIGRATQGVRLMELEGDDKIVSVALVEAANGDEPKIGSTGPTIVSTDSTNDSADATNDS